MNGPTWLNGWRLLLVIAAFGFLIYSCVGCVLVENNFIHSRGGAHQDVGRVTSSTQEGSVTADVPISLVPK